MKYVTAYDCPKCKKLKPIHLNMIQEPTEAQWSAILPKLKVSHPCQECK